MRNVRAPQESSATPKDKHTRPFAGDMSRIRVKLCTQKYRVILVSLYSSLSLSISLTRTRNIMW